MDEVKCTSKGQVDSGVVMSSCNVEMQNALSSVGDRINDPFVNSFDIRLDGANLYLYVKVA